MIAFKAKDVRQYGYTITLYGNGGECQLVIVYSWCQAASTPLLICSVMCDGSLAVLYRSVKLLTFIEVCTVLKRVLLKWGRTGLKPDAKQEAELEKQCSKFLFRVGELWHYTKK